VFPGAKDMPWLLGSLVPISNQLSQMRHSEVNALDRKILPIVEGFLAGKSA